MAVRSAGALRAGADRHRDAGNRRERLGRSGIVRIIADG
jgi:hypothetical protein